MTVLCYTFSILFIYEIKSILRNEAEVNTVQVELTEREIQIIKSVLLDSLSSNKYSYAVREEMNNLDDKLQARLEGK